MRELSERNYALRDAYAQLDPLIPRSSRLQYDPSVGGYFDYTHTLNANHQFVMAGPTCNTGFGGEQSACPPIHAAAYQLYTPDSTLTPTAAARLCRQIGADYLVRHALERHLAPVLKLALATSRHCRNPRRPHRRLLRTVDAEANAHV